MQKAGRKKLNIVPDITQKPLTPTARAMFGKHVLFGPSSGKVSACDSLEEAQTRMCIGYLASNGKVLVIPVGLLLFTLNTGYPRWAEEPKGIWEMSLGTLA